MNDRAKINPMPKTEEFESLLMSVSELKTDVRKAKVICAVFLVLTTSFVISLGVGLYNQLTNPHIRFISEGDTKTLIGVRNSGRIQADKDDRTGETIIEVYHAKK